MRKPSVSSVALVAAMLALPAAALAQESSDDPHHPGTAAEEQQATPASEGMMGQGMSGMMPQGMMGEGMMEGMGPMMGMGTGMSGMGPAAMGAMMATMASHHPAMMEMMHQAMGAAMQSMAGMGPAAMGGGLGVVTPSQHLSVDDVRDYFEHRLEAGGNPRLVLGDVREEDDGAISAEILTVDGSLVDRFNVDGHSGVIERAQ